MIHWQADDGLFGCLSEVEGKRRIDSWELSSLSMIFRFVGL